MAAYTDRRAYTYIIVKACKQPYVRVGFSRAREAQMPDDNKPLTIDVPTAGKRYFGLSRDASYEAARRGDIPTIRIGRLLRVPVRVLERMLDSAGDRVRNNRVEAV